MSRDHTVLDDAKARLVREALRKGVPATSYPIGPWLEEFADMLEDRSKLRDLLGAVAALLPGGNSDALG